MYKKENKQTLNFWPLNDFLEFFQKFFFLFFFLHSIHILFKLWKFTSMGQKIKISKDSRGKNVLMLFSQVDKMRHCV